MAIMTVRLRLSLAGLGALLTGSGLICLSATGAAAAPARVWLLVELAPVMVVAVLLLRQRPGHGVARLLALVATALGAGTVSEGLLAQAPAATVFVALLQIVHELAISTSLAAVAALLAVFPTGGATTQPRVATPPRQPLWSDIGR